MQYFLLLSSSATSHQEKGETREIEAADRVISLERREIVSR